MACIENKQEQAMNFLELRAKFNEANVEIKNGEEENGGNEGTTNKSVAEKKRIFESNQIGMFAADKPLPPLKPLREAPPPPPPRRLPNNFVKEENNNNLLLPMACSSSSQIPPPSAAAENEESERSESVKNVIQRFNKIGPRLFGPDTPSIDWLGYHKMGLGRLKEEEVEGEEEPDMGKEVDSNSEEESDLEGYSELSDATTETGGLMERISRSGSSIGKGDSTLTTRIIEEMREKGLFKKLPIETGLPSEVGGMRNAPKKSRKGYVSDPFKSMAFEGLPTTGICKSQTEPSGMGHENDLAISSRAKANLRSKWRRRTTTAGEEVMAKTVSMVSSQSGSTIMNEEIGTAVIPRYETGDEKENERLRELHSVAMEFLQVQRAYVDLLQHIGENYLNYLLECERRMNRKWLVPSGPNNQPHVIQQIAQQFQMILNVHKVFLEDFALKVAKWDSRKPDMAEVFQRKADYLKICNNFLKSKRKFAAVFQQALDENRELAYVTKKFEQGILNEGDEDGRKGGGGGGNAMNLKGISIVMQLDAVHQNVVRYKLLMERYRKYLPDNLVEANIADEALRKLTAVSNTVNEFLAGADADHKLVELHRKLQGVFDVFAPGRKLLHEGELRRQTRKELQLRYLILFSDMLLLCRYNGTLMSGGGDSFDASSLYKMPIEKVRLQVEEHEDYELEFVVQSPKKTSAFVAKSKRQRDQWVQRISEAMKAAKEKKIQRRSLAKMCTFEGHHHKVVEDKLSLESIVGTSSRFYQQPNGQQMERQISGEEEESPEIEEKPFEPTKTEPMNGNKRKSNLHSSTLPHSSSTPPINHHPRFEALWIPDNKATKCLMAGCDTRFSMLRRKHHCRQCGWLICQKCVGQAPVRMKGWARVKVCPQCFQENKNAFEQGKLFPPNMIILISPNPQQENGQKEATQDSTHLKYFSLDDPNLRIYYKKIDRSVPPSELFIAPSNGLLAKARIPVKEKELGEQTLASGKVYFRNRKGVPSLRWARLTREFLLQFYEAEFDDQAAETFFIYGYSVAFNETEDGGMIIELTHQNQIQTDRKEDQIVFHVLHSRSAEKWLATLQKILVIDEPLEGSTGTAEGEEKE